MNCKGLWWARGRWCQRAWQSIEPRQSLILRVTLLLVCTKCSWPHLQIRHKPKKLIQLATVTSTYHQQKAHPSIHVVITFAIPTHWAKTCGIETLNDITYTPSSFTGSGLCHFACQLSSQLHHVSRIGRKVKEDRGIGGEKEVSPSHQFGCALLFTGRNWGRLSGKSRDGRLLPSPYLLVQLYDGIHMMDVRTACWEIGIRFWGWDCEILVQICGICRMLCCSVADAVVTCMWLCLCC